MQFAQTRISTDTISENQLETAPKCADQNLKTRINTESTFWGIFDIPPKICSFGANF